MTVALASIFPLSAHAEVPLATRAVENFIQPAYGHFHQATVTLEADLENLCAAPNADNLSATRIDFTGTVAAWSKVETIRFGPVTQENRLERILFWPDRKSIGLKQVQAALADKDPSATDPGTLKGKSVAMQGLGALEFVLFGTGSETLAADADGYRCAYGLAIAANLQSMAAVISAEWEKPEGIGKQLANPGPANPLYRSNDESMTELFNVFVHGLELVRDVRINGFIGEDAGDDKPKQAIFWRSAGTIASIRANLDGVKDLFDAAGFAELLGSDSAYLPGSIDFEFANVDKALAKVDGPIENALGDPDKRASLIYGRLVTSSLSELFGVKLAGALGLTAGFSSLDGD